MGTRPNNIIRFSKSNRGQLERGAIRGEGSTDASMRVMWSDSPGLLDRCGPAEDGQSGITSCPLPLEPVGCAWSSSSTFRTRLVADPNHLQIECLRRVGLASFRAQIKHDRNEKPRCVNWPQTPTEVVRSSTRSFAGHRSWRERRTVL